MMMSNSKLKADNIFIKQFLSKTEWEKEKQALEYRFKLAQTLNMNRSDIKIRSASLFFRNKMIDTYLFIEENSCLLKNSPEFSWLQSSKFLRVLSLNCPSLLSMDRLVMLDIILKTIHPDIVCLTETWLNQINENQEALISQSYSIQSQSDR